MTYHHKEENTCLGRMNKYSHQFFDAIWRLQNCMSFQKFLRVLEVMMRETRVQLTRSRSDRLGVVIRNVVLNPLPIYIPFPLTFWICMNLLGNRTVT